jgi:hypothetical protein
MASHDQDDPKMENVEMRDAKAKKSEPRPVSIDMNERDPTHMNEHLAVRPGSMCSHTWLSLAARFPRHHCRAEQGDVQYGQSVGEQLSGGCGRWWWSVVVD